MQKKYLITLFITMIIFTSCNTDNYKEIKEVSILPFTDNTVQLSATIDSIYTLDTVRYIDVHISIQNKSAIDSLKYLSMDCAWTDIYTTDSRSLKVQKNICFLNWYVVNKIAPWQKDEQRLTLIVKDHLPVGFFKVGVNIIKVPDESKMPTDHALLTNMEHVIWSNDLRINN